MTTPSSRPQLGRLAISLWDFSWFTRAAPGEPFENLDSALAEAVERGYNAVRICAAPLLLFGDHDIDVTDLDIVPVAPGVGRGTRWYDVAGCEGMDLRARFFELFRAARDHDVKVIVSSWEYQQSPAFLSTSAWHDMLTAIRPQDRHLALARALGRLLDALAEEDLIDAVAYVELHNEVDLSRLREVAGPEADTYRAQKPYLEQALAYLQDRVPSVPSTVCYGIPPHLDMTVVPDSAQIAHMHIYVYGVLGALEAWAAVRADGPVFPTPELQSLLRDDAPAFEDWAHTIEPWRLEATGISPRMFYAYDWVDPVRWDAWLYRHHAQHEVAMLQAASDRLRATRIWAQAHDVPAVIGEGWIGYTPLHAEYEDGPVGQHLAEHMIREAVGLGFAGLVVGSNSAPHQPPWRNVAFQRRMNRLITAG